MKKTLLNRIPVFTAAMIGTFALTACGSEPVQSTVRQQPQSQTVSQTSVSTEAVGTVLLSINPEISVSYDELGNVVELMGNNDDGRQIIQACTDYQGQNCTVVLPMLIEEIYNAGYFDETIENHEKNIILKLENGSQYPDDDFLEEIAEEIRIIVDEYQIGSAAMTVDEDDLDDTYRAQGYINEQTAEEILKAQLERDDIQFVEKDYDIDDGIYEIEFVLDNVEYEYNVDAYTGKVMEAEADADDDHDDVYDDDHDDVNDDAYDDAYDDDYDDVNDDAYDDAYDDDYDDVNDDDYDDVYDDDYDDVNDDNYDDVNDDAYDDVYDDDYDDVNDDDYDDVNDDDYDDVYDDDYNDDAYDDDYDDVNDDDYDDVYDDDYNDDAYDDDYDDVNDDDSDDD